MALPAAIVDYDTLIQAVREYLINEDATDTDIAFFIRQAEDDFRQEIKIEALAESTGQFVDGEQKVAVPDDFLELIAFYYEIASDQVVLLTYHDPRSFWDRQASVQQSVPAYYTRIGESFFIGPIPDSDYTYNIQYIQSLPSLSSTNQTNYLLDVDTNVYLYGSLYKAYEFFQDDNQVQKYKAMYTESRDALQKADARRRYRPGPQERSLNLDDSTWKLV